MSNKANWKLGLWATCLLTGSGVLYGQWRESEVHSVSEPPPVRVVESMDVAMDEQYAFKEHVVASAPVATQSDLDIRLVARLLVESVTQVESAGNPRMVGGHGERGLMQIKADTWNDTTSRLFGRRVPFTRAFEGKLNQQVGSAYLDNLQTFLSRHQRLWRADERSLILACYNAGPERVRRAGFDLRRLPAHTQDYVKRTSALHDALLADHHVDPSQVRLALAASLKAAGGS